MKQVTMRPTAASFLAIVALLALSACSQGDAAATTKGGDAIIVGPEAIAVVKLDSIESGPVVQGTITPEREARLRAQVGGPVLSTLVEQGQRVSGRSRHTATNRGQRF